MVKKNWMSLLLIVVLLGSLLSACSGSNSSTTPADNGTKPTDQTTDPGKKDPEPSKEGPSGTLTIGTFSDIVSINPIYIQDTSSGDAEYLIQAKLYDLNREANVTAEPWSLAAELPQISEDGLTYTIKLKPEAKWNDGQPVTADDVKFTIDTVRNPDAGSPGISSYDKVDSVTKIDEKTVQIKLKQVYAPFLYTLSTTLAPYHILKDVPVADLKNHAYGTDPAKTVTNGPWKWTEWKQKQHHTFEADPNYWGAVKPKIAKLVYKIYADQNTEIQALIKGDIDTVAAIPVTQLAAVEANKDINVILAPGPTYEFLGFNFDDKNFKDGSPFKGEKTRQAIAHAINRQGMVDNVLKGTGKIMNAPFLPGSWADPPSAINYDYNAEQAKKLLAEDGWVAGSDGILTKDGKRFSFELQYNAGNNRREQVSAIIQQNLKDVGIEVTTKGIDFAAWNEQNLTPGKYQAILLAWSLSNPDPDAESIFSSKYFPPTGQNSGWYKNEKLDQLWVDGTSVVDQEARKKIYDEIGKEISTDLPYVFLYQYGMPIGMGPKVKYTEEDRPEPSLAYGSMFHIINWSVE